MVCSRCIKVVSEELKILGLDMQHIQLGKVKLATQPSKEELNNIRSVLNKNGFELLDDKKSMTVESIKVLIIEGIRNNNISDLNINISQYISNQIQMEYSYLSHLFSSVEGKTIERFVILQKIERVKELLLDDELSIKQISAKVGYSSLQALSNQFKKETGLNPRDFKRNANDIVRKSLNDI